MDDPVLAFLNSPLGAVVKVAIGALFWVLIPLPLFWWRDRRRRRRWRQEDLVRQQLWDLED